MNIQQDIEDSYYMNNENNATSYSLECIELRLYLLTGTIFYSFNDSTIRTLIKDVNRVKLNGNCCAILFQGLNYGKQNQTLPIGFDATPEVKTIRSFKIEQCHSDI